MRPKEVFGSAGFCERRRASAKAGGVLCVATRCSDFVVPAVDISELSVADTNGFLQHGLQNRLKIAGGAADDLKHLRRCRLLLQGFCEVGGAFGEVRGALTQFVEQPRVLDGDDRLGGEVRYQCDLLFGKGANFLAVKVNAPISSFSFSIGTPNKVRTPPSSTASTAAGSLRQYNPAVPQHRRLEPAL